MCCITVFARTSVVLRLLWCSRGTHRAVLLPRSGVFGGGCVDATGLTVNFWIIFALFL